MARPNLRVVAEGDLPTGEHWVLKAGGTAEDYCTFLETVHVDGHRDEGGMGGPPLDHGRYLNMYTGGSDQGLQRVIVRSDSRIRRLRMELDTGERRMLPPVATDPAAGLAFFVALLPWSVRPVALDALDGDGQVVSSCPLRRVPPPPWYG
jgi:hypothetical protein